MDSSFFSVSDYGTIRYGSDPFCLDGFDGETENVNHIRRRARRATPPFVTKVVVRVSPSHEKKLPTKKG